MPLPNNEPGSELSLVELFERFNAGDFDMAPVVPEPVPVPERTIFDWNDQPEIAGNLAEPDDKPLRQTIKACTAGMFGGLGMLWIGAQGEDLPHQVVEGVGFIAAGFCGSIAMLGSMLGCAPKRSRRI